MGQTAVQVHPASPYIHAKSEFRLKPPSRIRETDLKLIVYFVHGRKARDKLPLLRRNNAAIYVYTM